MMRGYFFATNIKFNKRKEGIAIKLPLKFSIDSR